MTSTMTITIAQDNGHSLYFKIEFAKSDFMEVVDAITEDMTIEDVTNSDLWKII